MPACGGRAAGQGYMGVTKMRQIRLAAVRANNFSRIVFMGTVCAAALALFTVAKTPSAVAASLGTTSLSTQMNPNRPALQLVDIQQWYEGGTLHRVTVRTWSRSTRRNQLATAADWAVHVLGDPRVREIGMSGVRVHATSLVTCINSSIGPVFPVSNYETDRLNC